MTTFKTKTDRSLATDVAGILHIAKRNPSAVMSEGYLGLWNSSEQERIDRDIAAHRMVDADATFEQIPQGTSVRVEQVSHEFVFGAHIFNFDQLGSDECNARYKALYGELFNSATIPFYWKKFEPEEGRPRFEPAHEDTAEFWNTVESPETQPHWRRPPTDPLVEFCEAKGIRRHGHTLVWGNARWHAPDWLFDKIPANYRSTSGENDGNPSVRGVPMFDSHTPEQIEKLLPDYTKDLHALMARRIAEIALRYRGRLQSWDVVNESATDFGRGNLRPSEGICKSWYGLMPGDYAFRAFKLAEAYFPPGVVLNINDYHLENHDYLDEIQDLKTRGCRVDVAGAQMHIFDPQICVDIAEGRSDLQSPQRVREALDRLSRSGCAIHMSEITIVSPGGDERGELIQAIIARNLYRLWFSLEPVMGITWWNVVDGCGAPGEPSLSGLFTRDMSPKAAYHVMNDLIRNEWTTRMTLSAGDNGAVRFRGFPGKYRLTWNGDDGTERSLVCTLSKSAGLRAVFD